MQSSEKTKLVSALMAGALILTFAAVGCAKKEQPAAEPKADAAIEKAGTAEPPAKPEEPKKSEHPEHPR